jgi:hypothetical protein
MKEYTLEEQGSHNREFVNLQVQSLVAKLFKSNLVTLDTLKEHSEVSDAVAKEARKRILDSGNDTVRELLNLIDVFDFYINPERLRAARENRKVVKKVTVSGHYVVQEK